MDPTISPALRAELILAQMKLSDVLKGTADLRQYHLDEVEAASKIVKRKLSRFLRTTSFEPAKEAPDFDYKEVMDILVDPDTAAASERLFEQVKDPELATDVGIVAAKTAAYLKQVMPRNPVQTITGTTMAEPDPTSLADFKRVYQVAEDPFLVLDDLLEGCLSPDQVQVLALLDPNIYQLILETLAQELATAVAAKGIGWSPPKAKERQLLVLRMQPTTDTALLQAMQAQYQEGATAPTPKRRSSKQDLPQLTPGQQAASGQSSQ